MIWNKHRPDLVARILPSLLYEKANNIYSRLDIDTCRSYDSVKTEILRGFRLNPKAYLQKFRTMKRYGEDSYSQFLHKLKDVQNYYLESKQITEFQSLCDDMLLEQFRSELPGEFGVFVDQRHVSGYGDGETSWSVLRVEQRWKYKFYARRNFCSRGKQPFKPKNFQTSNVNFEPSKNSVNAVSMDRNLEWVAQKLMTSQIRCFHCKMPNHIRSECPRLQPRSNNCARVGRESQQISGSQFVIP